MFGIWKRKRPVVFEHWFVALDDFRSSAADFYREVEEELGRREIPDLTVDRVVLAAGALGGGGREYLRMARERVVFDVCAAPFGTGWFYSCRIAMLPFRIRVWELLLLLLIGLNFVWPYILVFGFVWGPVVFVASAVAALTLMNVFVASPTRSLDSVLLCIPCIGALYELFLRRNNTYYQDDARLIYATVVGRVIREKTSEFASAGGIQEVEFHQVADPKSPESWWKQVTETFALLPGKSRPGRR